MAGVRGFIVTRFYTNNHGMLTIRSWQRWDCTQVFGQLVTTCKYERRY